MTAMLSSFDIISDSSYCNMAESKERWFAWTGGRMIGSIGIRIKKARRAAGLTQAELAERLGIGRSAVGNWESCTDVSPASARIREIAIITSVSYEWLATGRGDPASHIFDRLVLDAELVEDPIERRLLSAFRACRAATRQILLQMIESQATQSP